MRPRISPFFAFRAVLCLATAGMMAISWPLWVSGGLFPKVPFVGGIRLLPIWASWIRFGIAIAAMLTAATGFRWRIAVGVALGLSAWMVLEDQFRLQPWMYQFLLMGFALAACPEGQAFALCRLFLVAMYFYSGLSKLNGSFVDEMGQSFLATATGMVGLDSFRWPISWRNACILAMPCWEIAVAAGFLLRARRAAMAGAVLQHLALIAILGPWAMGHSAIVLLWNAVLIVQILILFGWPIATSISETRRWPLAGTARFATLAAALLPLGEPWGLWDAWPSFALYASHVESVSIAINPERRDRLPPSIRNYGMSLGIGAVTLEAMSLGAWSLGERRVPLYPSARAQSGVAEALIARYGDRVILRVGIASRANRRDRKRDVTAVSDLAAIRRFGDSYWLNAHPAP